MNIEVKCGKCGADFTTPAPALVVAANMFLSQVSLVMRQEIRCTGCNAVFTPVIQPQVVGFQQVEDLGARSVIVPPTGGLVNALGRHA